MADDVFIINEGNVVITAGKAPDKKTVTILIGDTSHKIRDVTADRESEILRRAGSSFNPTDWIRIGTGQNAVLVARADVHDGISKIENEEKRRKVDRAVATHFTERAAVKTLAPPVATASEETMELEIASRVFQGIPAELGGGASIRDERRRAILDHLKTQTYKIVVKMIDNQLQVFAKKKIAEGTFKEVSILRSIWQQNTSSLESFGPVVVYAKAKPGIPPEELEVELPVASALAKLKVTHALKIHRVTRGDSKKVGLMMEYCGGGDMVGYFSDDKYDPETHRISPQFRSEAIAMLFEVANTLHRMHKDLQMIHSDLKRENVLIYLRSATERETRLSDFGGALDLRDTGEQKAWTFPPPEELELLEKKTDITFSDAIDAWALGVLIFSVMHNYPDLLERLKFSSQSHGIRAALPEILKKLDLTDKVDQIIMSLINPDRNKRITTYKALQLLKKILPPPAAAPKRTRGEISEALQASEEAASPRSPPTQQPVARRRKQ